VILPLTESLAVSFRQTLFCANFWMAVVFLHRKQDGSLCAPRSAGRVPWNPMICWIVSFFDGEEINRRSVSQIRGHRFFPFRSVDSLCVSLDTFY